MNEENALNLDEAADVIRDTLMAEPEPTPEPEPVPEPTPEPQGPSELDIQQGKLVAYEQALRDETDSIRAAEIAAKEIRHENPGEYAARLVEINERRNVVTAAYNKYKQAVNQVGTGVSEQLTAQQQQHLNSERQKLEKAIPGWNPETHGEKVASFLRGQGYSNEQLSQVDAKTIKLAWDAMHAQKPRKSLPRKKVDPRALAEQNIARSHENPGSVQAGAERIMALMGASK